MVPDFHKDINYFQNKYNTKEIVEFNILIDNNEL